MESIGILCLHLLLRPHVTWTSSGIWGKWHICSWRRWDRPWLVLWLHGNLLQYGDTLLLVSQVVHLTPHHRMALLVSGTCEQGVERALHLKQFWWCRLVMCWLNCLSLGSKHSRTAVSCSQMMSQIKELSVPLVLVLSALELPDGELGKDTEDSLVVVSVTGCELAGWESLDDGCGSLRSECLAVTLVCLIGMSRSGSVTFSLKFLLFLVEVSRPGCLLGGIWHSAGHRVVLKPCHLGSSTRLDPPVWHCLWN